MNPVPVSQPVFLRPIELFKMPSDVSSPNSLPQNNVHGDRNAE
jgi:hypothetical protein